MCKGKVTLGSHHVDAPDELKHAEEKSSQAFVRPHEIGISRIRRSEADLTGTIQEVRIMGGQIGLNFGREGFEHPIDAEIPRDLYNNLGLAKGEKVFVSLNKGTVFTGDYVI